MRIQLHDAVEHASTGSPHDDFAPYIDTFLLPGAAAAGAVLVCPGGGYAGRADYEGDPIAEKFNELGFHAFVVQYRVSPYRYPAALSDALQAIRLIRSNAERWHVDSSHIAILGFSAGAHLAASAGLLWNEIPEEGGKTAGVSGRPDAMILCYPVIAASEPFAHRGSMVNLLGENMPKNLLRKMDLHKAVNEETPPAFLWHTADDPCVPVRNSTAFAEAMWSCGNSCELHIFPHGSHGLGLGRDSFPEVAQWPALAANFLEHEAGFPKQA